MDRLVRTLFEEQQIRLARPLVPRNLEFASRKARIDVAVGMRRVGKTCFLLQTAQRLIAAGVPAESVLYVSFDDDRLEPLSSAGAAGLVDGFYSVFPENHDRTCHLFLDEIHNVDGWSRLVRRLYDTKDARLYLSGSSAKLLGVEIATELRGRAMPTEVWPFSFTEYLGAVGASVDTSVLGRRALDLLRKRLREYLLSGGFPEVVAADAADRVRILQDYAETVVLRDVVERHGITNISAARYLTRLLLRGVGRAFSVHKTYGDLRSQGRKLGKDTLYEYLAHLEDAFLCFAVPLYDRSTRRAENAPSKIYAADTGLAAAFNFTTADDLGQLFENLVYLDLRRAGKRVFYYLTADRREVDFVAVGAKGRAELIQVCWDASSQATLQREEAALAAARKELGVPGRLVTPESYLERAFGRA
jgi:predicted AAA+ superfamily ATPase